MKRGSVATALLLALASPAQAEGGEAERLFLEGRSLREAGRHEDACARFRASLELAIVPNTLFNVAQCEEEEGTLGAAVARFREGLALLPDDDERREIVTRRIEALEARLAHLVITIPADAPEGATLRVDGQVVTPGLVTLDPGRHEVTLEAPGHAPSSARIELGEGEQRTLSISLALAAPRGSTTPDPHEEPPPDAPRGEAMAIGGWVALAVGAAGLTAAAVTGGVLLDRDERIRALCPAERCSPEGRTAIQEVEPLLIGNAVSWAVGIAGAGLGISLLVASALEDAPVSVGVGPGGAVVMGSF